MNLLLEGENIRIVNYKDDHNILDTHREVLSLFVSLKGKVSDKKKRIGELSSIIPSNINHKRMIDREIATLHEYIELVDNGDLFSSYTERTAPIISSYQDVIGKYKKVFGKKTTLNDADSYKRSELVGEYLSVVQEFLPIQIVYDFQYDISLCPNCIVSMEQQSGMYLCTFCGFNVAITTSDSYQSGFRKNINVSKNNYEDQLNFEKAIKRYKGEQLNKLPIDLYDKLNGYFTSYGQLTQSDILRLPLSPDGTRGPYGRDSIIRALKEIGYSGFYEDINLISHIYWGWELPKIDNIEKQLIEDYEKSQAIYERIKSEDGRSSCINVNYRLFRHLRRLGHNCRREDFKMIQTRDILEEYEVIWKKICGELKWEFESIL